MDDTTGKKSYVHGTDPFNPNFTSVYAVPDPEPFSSPPMAVPTPSPPGAMDAERLERLEDLMARIHAGVEEMRHRGRADAQVDEGVTELVMRLERDSAELSDALVVLRHGQEEALERIERLEQAQDAVLTSETDRMFRMLDPLFTALCEAYTRTRSTLQRSESWEKLEGEKRTDDKKRT